MSKKDISELLSTDTFGLLSDSKVVSKKTTKTDIERLKNSFFEIVQFYEENGRLPSDNGDFLELKLYSRLEAIKEDPEKVRILLPFDLHNLLDLESTRTISDIDLIDDPLHLLDVDEDDDIFILSHVSSNGRIRPDFIAHRHICKDFDSYKPAFDKIKEDLSLGKRKLVQYKEGSLKVGNFYVISGVLVLLENADTSLDSYEYASGTREREDGRTLCIFDNGTESTMLFRSLGKALQKNGFAISEILDGESLTVDGSNICEEDKTNGFIYVLKSKSDDPAIKQMSNLYKIGYCTTTISERISDAKNDPTYLMADVQLVLSVKCFNLNVPNLEDTIHQFFSNSNIQFKIMGRDGQYHYPKEWFQVPLKIVEEAITLIINGSIDSYYYDKEAKLIVKK